ncbi:4-hydroxyphenylacetate decarboxylase large subunit [bacterium BMS3Bbin02]|nr:4-hydroxyphenylacetate decarboxylase large subunit [bacterium BMS3Bbin02]
MLLADRAGLRSVAVSTLDRPFKEVSTRMSDWQPSPEIQALYSDHLESRPGLGAERALHYTRYWKRQVDKDTPSCLANAGALAYHLEERSIQIHPGELIVGSHTEHRVGAICHIEKTGSVMLEDLFRFEKRSVNPLHVDSGVKWALLRSSIPYWLRRNLVMRAFPMREGLKYAGDQLRAAHFVINEAAGVAHFLPDYEQVIRLGTDGLRAKVEARIAQGDLDVQGQEYLDASLVCLTAVEHFADRYRDLAQSLGRDDVAEVLSHVPRRPARNLREALQLIWLFQLLIQVESIDQGISLGRMDQYLYPLFCEEKKRADYDADDVRDLFAAFCIKLSEVIPLFSGRATEYYAGLPSGQALSIGGVDANGNDATNELTYLLLDVMKGFQTRQPNWHARVSTRSDDAYVRRVVDVVAAGGGSPALYNDDVIMPAMVERGVDAAKVWNYATVGCVEPALPRESFTSSDAAIFNLAIGLELVFGDGNRLKKGKVCERPWLAKIHSMAELLEQVEVRTNERIRELKHALDAIERANAGFFPTPLSSLTIGGCIESATDATRGGAWYNASGIQGVGVADLANSLAVIETLVFREEQYTLEELANACATDFVDHELLRARALKITAFGNDDPLVDDLATEAVEMFDRCVSQHTNTRGGRWMPGFYSMTCHQGFGKQTAAMPSGRLAGRPLADGLAPVDGSDRLGPTASLNSVAKFDHRRFGNGINVNIKFDAATVAGREGKEALEALIYGYFAQGGMQMQVNVVDPEVLKQALHDPESHRNLLVRISGYCAYFVDLTPAMQQELIDRTRQRV